MPEPGMWSPRVKKQAIALSCGLVAVVLAGAAQGADLQPRMPVKAPPMEPAYSWTGIYVGAHLGSAWGREESTIASASVIAPVGLITSGDLDGFLGGGQIGANYQFGRWVTGLQFDISGTDYRGNTSVPILMGLTAIGHNNTDWFSTLTARLGYTWNNYLFYAKGGGAWTRVKYTSDIFNGGGLVATGSRGDTRAGWTVGTGIEYGFWKNWSGFLEYDYLDFGTKRYPFTVAGGGGSASNLVDIDTHVHIVKMGINYRMDWNGPLYAKY